MPRTEPSVNLQWAETHVVIKATLADGTILRLGTATLSSIPEEDSNLYSYQAKIVRDSEVKMSSTSAADQMTLDAENVDKALGLTINDVSKVLAGAKVTCSKVFAPIENIVTINPYLPVFWFDASEIDAKPNKVITQWNDKSANVNNAVGSGILRVNKINGFDAVEFNTSSNFMTIGSGAFQTAHLFAVVLFPASTFVKGAIVGSATTGERLFSFTNGGTNMETLPREVRKDGNDLSGSFDLAPLTTPMLLNIKAANPTASRIQYINKMETFLSNFYVSELIGFGSDLTSLQAQHVETYLANKYSRVLPYSLPRTWERKVLLTGEISEAPVDEEVVNIKIVSDVAPNVAFIGARPIQTHCPLIFKGKKCGYVGSETVCNKLYQSEGGCSGRNNQHRFGGVVATGELGRIIPGGVDTQVGDDERFTIRGTPYPDEERNRQLLLL